ncbi:MAG: tetratricopeptide repeat protein [Gemmatimonadota bacterium]|nr:MAG: tetratricopeptide repeat protein [Gemmatimonadota bacterium]
MSREARPEPRPTLPSLLTRSLRGLLAVALALAAFMLANTAYLLLNRLGDALGWGFFAVSDTSLPKLFQAMLLTHTGVGLLLVAAMLGFFGAHLPKVWKRRHRGSVLSGILFALAGLTLAVTGTFILTAAASRDNRWAWWAHVICAALAGLGYIVHRRVSYARPPGTAFRRFGLGVAAGAALLVAAHGFTNRGIELTAEAQAARERGLGAGPGARSRELAKFAADPFVPRDFVPPESPFFPSPATTTSGGYLPARIITRDDPGSLPDDVKREAERNGFVSEIPIGAGTCVRCHPDIVDQWATSAHRFASFNNPFYEATIDDMRRNATLPNASVETHMRRFSLTTEGAGRVKSKWCSGCHDPALMLAGRMDGEIDRASVEAQAGLTCLACHAIDLIHDQTGNGNYNIADEQEDPYLFAGGKPGTWAEFLHDAALKAKPTVHKRQLLKPFFRQSEFCATCHKVSLTEPVNDYRWLRGQNEYDAWHDSGVSLNASRTFYLPEERRLCQDCHMPLEPAPRGDVSAKGGMVRSHRFLAVNTALPFVRGDEQTIRRIEAYLRAEKLGVDIFALRSARTGESSIPVDRSPPAVQPGERITVDVVVRNKGVGHTFPGGTNDSNEGWLEFTVLDEKGDVLAISGAVGEDGHLDPLAHVYNAVILDRFGNLIDRRNAADIHVTAASNVIPPGMADVAHFELVVPAEMAGRELTLRARLLWRKFNRRYTEFAYEANPSGFKRFQGVPELPITEIAAAEVALRVRSGEPSTGGTVRPAGPAEVSAPDEAAGPAEWIRSNDYGIALLREGNTRAALSAFERVAELQPGRVDGPLNMARVALREGNIETAYEFLREAEEVRPGDARVAWVWGGALQEDGRYEEAALAYRRVLEDFPADRAAWRSLGRTLYLDGRYEEALIAFDRVLEIDPEDRVSHYHRMLCYRALGREAESEAAAAAYERYRIDESAQAIAGAFRLANPGVNLMAQPIHTHTVSPAR